MISDSETEWGDWASGRPVGPISQTENINGRIRHRIPKPTPADRPRAAHKLNLRDGDVVELVAWQDGRTDFIGVKGVQKDGLVRLPDVNRVSRNSFYPKGHRPLFRVISRAADAKQVVWTELVVGKNLTQPVMRMPEAAGAKPDEVIVMTGWRNHRGWSFAEELYPGSDTHRLTLTFPHGSDVGTVTREKL